ncbi:hypothetical protein [Roseateles sp. BYS96W]|uniref:Uncharacterized protein n=1 Tax=Pelomonas nitida TaxID=3299027 RepID=A0ABW7GCY7_9BURK
MTTLLVDDKTADAYAITYTTDQPDELVAHVGGHAGALIEVLCLLPHEGRWTPRRISELWTGTVGHASVLVLREQEGELFCPEMPDFPMNAVGGLQQLRSVVRPELSPPSRGPGELPT